MRFKLDENMLKGLEAIILSTGNHDVHHVIDEQLRGIRDKDLCDVCRQEKRILVTFDRHFNQQGRIPRDVHCGVIWIRMHACSPAEIYRVFRKFLYTNDPESLLNHFIKITKNGIDFLV